MNTLDRSVRAVVAYDQALQPIHYSIFLRDEDDLVLERCDHFDAFIDLNEALALVHTELAKAMVEVGWWG